MIKYLKKINWIPYLIALPLSVLKYTIFALTLENILNGIQNHTFQDFRTSVLSGIIIVGLFTLVMIAQTITKYNKAIIIQHAMKRIRNDLITCVLNKSETEILDHQDVMTSILFNDLKLIETDYFPNLFLIFEQSLGLCMAIIIIFTRSWKLGLLLIIGNFIPTIFPKLFKKKTMFYSTKWSNTNQVLTKGVNELLKGIITIKTYNNESIQRIILNKRTEDLEKCTVKFTMIKEFCSNLILGTGLMVTSLSFLYSAYLVIQGEITLGGMMAVMQMSNAIYEPITSITTSRNAIISTKTIRNKIEKEIKLFSSLKFSANEANSLNFQIELRDVSYSISNQEIINKLSIIIHQNTKILVIGANGSGKSTLLKLIQGRIQEYFGEINFNGISIQSIPKNELYSYSSFVQQNVFIFDDSLINNITLHESFSREKIKNVIKLVELEEIIKTKGTTTLGENGSHLSGGQKQKIEIARALIRNREILFLDEAFSAIDKESSQRIEAKILKEYKKTLFSIEHTISEKNLNLYDRVLVLKDGVIKEDGTPKELCNNTDSFIYNLIQNKAN